MRPAPVPPVFAFLQDQGCLITRFVSGAHIPMADLEREPVLASVVGSIRAIHACAPIGATFPVFRIVEAYRRIASDRGVAIAAAYDEAHALADRIEAAFAHYPVPLALCHDDLLNANFLLDGDHVWIVDYEYAGMGDPFFDLGNLSVNNGMSHGCAGDAAAPLLRVGARRASRPPGPDADHVRLP